MGYTSKEATQGKFYIIGAQFEDVANGGTPINGTLTGVEGVDYDDSGAFLTTAAQIQVPATVGYTIYYYLNDGYYEDENGNEAYKAGWCDSDGNIVDASFTPGVAAWFKSVPGDGAATIAGAVSDESNKSVDCPVGFALRANTFPITANLNSDAISSDDIVGVDYDDSGAFLTTSAQLQIPATVGYTIYYYLNDGYYEDENGAEAYKAGWCDSDGNIVDTSIPAGQGFWTKGVSGPFTLKFAK